MVNKINEYDTEYIIPYGQTEVSEDEFSHCRDLEKLYVPSYVAKIDEKNFIERNPKKIFVHHYQLCLAICGEKGTYAESCARSVGVRFIEADRWIKGNLLRAYFGRSEEVKIAEVINTIVNGAFRYAPHVKSIEMPDSLKYIESEAFMGCDLEEVKIPVGVKALGSRVFKDCANLKCVVFENGQTKLDNDCFLGCSDELVINAPCGGYVEEYANKYGIKFKSI